MNNEYIQTVDQLELSPFRRVKIGNDETLNHYAGFVLTIEQIKSRHPKIGDVGASNPGAAATKE